MQTLHLAWVGLGQQRRFPATSVLLWDSLVLEVENLAARVDHGNGAPNIQAVSVMPNPDCGAAVDDSWQPVANAFE